MTRYPASIKESVGALIGPVVESIRTDRKGRVVLSFAARDPATEARHVRTLAKRIARDAPKNPRYFRTLCRLADQTGLRRERVLARLARQGIADARRVKWSQPRPLRLGERGRTHHRRWDRYMWPRTDVFVYAFMRHASNYVRRWLEPDGQEPTGITDAASDRIDALADQRSPLPDAASETAEHDAQLARIKDAFLGVLRGAQRRAAESYWERALHDTPVGKADRPRWQAARAQNPAAFAALQAALRRLAAESH